MIDDFQISKIAVHGWIELHLQYPYSILELCVSVGVKSADLASGLYCVEFSNFDMDKDHHN